MERVRRRREEVQGTAEDWPDEVDDFRWELGPDPDDPLWDELAEEAAYRDMMERGLSPF